MKNTALVTALGGALALTLSACAPEAEAPEDVVDPVATEIAEVPVDERTDECLDPNEDGTCNDEGNPGDRTGPPETPTGTDDRREMQQ